jgi:hypothetical protein
MPGTVAAAADERKHMFDSALDIRRSTAHADGMARTYVRRRRRLAAALLLVLVSALGSPVARAVAEPEAATGAGGEADPAYVVEPGDTLWAIATRWAPGHDPREVVHLVVELNDLQTVSLVPGQRLTLPTLA